MKHHKFGNSSVFHLTNVHTDLIKICYLALQISPIDFSITCGHRSDEEQYQLFLEGKTTLDGKENKSKHQANPSKAIDFLPYPTEVNGINVWQDNMRFTLIAGVFFAAANYLGIKIRWGGDWDGDGNSADQKFHDLPHIELID